MSQNKNLLRKYSHKSISEELRSQNKSNDFFEIMLGNLTLEEILALKIEISLRSLGFFLRGFPLFKSSKFIITDALLRAAISLTPNKESACGLLGITKNEFYKLIKKHKLDIYFSYGGKENGKRKE
jgi:hypothetical protein